QPHRNRLKTIDQVVISIRARFDSRCPIAKLFIYPRRPQISRLDDVPVGRYVSAIDNGHREYLLCYFTVAVARKWPMCPALATSPPPRARLGLGSTTCAAYGQVVQ